MSAEREDDNAPQAVVNFHRPCMHQVVIPFLDHEFHPAHPTTTGHDRGHGLPVKQPFKE